MSDKVYNLLSEERQTDEKRRSFWIVIFLLLIIAFVVNLANIYATYSDIFTFFNTVPDTDCPDPWKLVLAVEYPWLENFMELPFTNNVVPRFIIDLIRGTKSIDSTLINTALFCSNNCPPNNACIGTYLKNWKDPNNPFATLIPESAQIVKDAKNGKPIALQTLFDKGFIGYANAYYSASTSEIDLWNYLFGRNITPPCKSNPTAFGLSIASGAINMGLMGAFAAGPLGWSVAGVAIGGAILGGFISGYNAKSKICQ